MSQLPQGSNNRVGRASLLHRLALWSLLAWFGAGTYASAQTAYPVPTNAAAGFPAWWFQRGVIIPSNPTKPSPSWPGDYPTPDDYSVVNQGQLKNIATAANVHLQTYLPPSLLAQSNAIALTTLISGWTTNPSTIADNYAAVNQGQLKALAGAFYDVLGSGSYTAGIGLPPRGWTNGPYPWTSNSNSSDPYAVANIGQVKYLFSFDLSAPTGQVPAWWVQYYLGSTNASPASQSPAGNGLTLLQAYQLGANPTNYYSQGSNPIIPVLSIVSGNNQSSLAGVSFASPLTIQVNGGSVLSNAPVSFTVSSGTGLLATNSTGTPTFATTLSLRTGTNGQAQVYLQDPNVGIDTITVTAGTSLPVLFNATNLPAPVQFSAASGTYYGSQSVTLTTPTLGATIYYTTDGSTPTMNSTLYTGSISVTTATTIKAIAVQYGILSTEGSVSMNIINPVLTIVSGNNQALNPGAKASLLVQIADTNGNLLANVPVSLAASGTGLIGTNAAGTFSSTNQILSGTNGQIRFYAQMPNPQTNFTVTASVGSTNTQSSVLFNVLQEVLPNSIDKLALWFKSDSGIATSGTNVTGWTNAISTNLAVTQTSSNNQPVLVTNGINGLPVVRFNGGKWLYSSINANTLANLNADMTMIVVAATTNSFPQQYSMYLGPGGTGQNRGMGYFQSRQLMDTYSIYGQGIASPEMNIFVAESWTLNTNCTALKLYRNGFQTAATTLSGVQNIGSGITLGAIPYAYGYGWQGDIAEVLVYDHQLTSNELAQVNQYIGDRYGMYNAYASWTNNYTPAVQAQIAKHQWSQQQANAYVAMQTANTNVMTAGLSMWYRADAGVTTNSTNGKVISWADQTGNYSVSQSSSNNQPILVTNALAGQPALRFNGSQFLNNPKQIDPGMNGDMTMIVVAATTNSFPQQYSMYLGPGGTGQNRGMGYFQSRQLMDTYSIYGQGIASPEMNIFVAESWTLNTNCTALKLYRNGFQTAATTLSGVQNIGSGITLGAIPYAYGYGWQGDIAEVLVYDHQLTSNELAQVNQYIGDRYGMYNAYASWTNNYTPAVQAQIAKHQWSQQQANAYVAMQTANTNVMTAGLSMWYRADAGVTTNSTNGKVISWADQTGNYSVSQSSSNNQPILVTNALAGQPALRFNGSQFLNNPKQIDPGMNGDMTMIVVAATTNSFPQQYSMYLGPGGTGQNRGMGYFQSRQLMDTYSIYGQGIASPEMNIFVAESWTLNTNCTALKLYRNGFQTAATTLSGVQNIGSGITLGAIPYAYGYGWQGDIAEVLVYDHQLTSNELAQVNQYIGDRYGMYNAYASWTNNYTPAVQAQIAKHQWSQQQANAYVAMQTANTNVMTAGLSMWYRADAGVTTNSTNGKVISWADQTGNYSVSQSSSNNQPILVTNALAGQPALRFNGSQFLNNPKQIDPGMNGDMTMITVVSSTNTGTSQFSFCLGSSASGQARGLGYGSSLQYFTSHANDTTGTNVPDRGIFVSEAFTLGTNGTNVTFYRNAIQTGAKTIGRVNNIGSGITLGGLSWGGYWQGDIAEVLVYDHQLTSNELAQVNIYLTVKYGLSCSVPAPVLSPNGGSDTTSITVSLSSTISPAVVRYTLDGITPDNNSPLYTGQLTLTQSTLLQAAVFLNGVMISPISTAQFYIGDTYQIGISDSWQLQYFGTISNLNPNAPVPGGSGLTYLQAYQWGYDPTKYSSNGDGLSDYLNHLLGYAANNFDINGNGLSNAQDLALGLNPFYSNPQYTPAPVSNPSDYSIPTIILNQPAGAALKNTIRPTPTPLPTPTPVFTPYVG